MAHLNTQEEFLTEFRESLERAHERAKTDKSFRQGLLTDPISTLKQVGAPVTPGMKIRYHEVQQKDEIVLPLPPYEGED